MYWYLDNWYWYLHVLVVSHGFSAQIQTTLALKSPGPSFSVAADVTDGCSNEKSSIGHLLLFTVLLMYRRSSCTTNHVIRPQVPDAVAMPTERGLHYYVTCWNQLTWTSRRHDLLIENKRLWLLTTDSFQSPLMRSKVADPHTSESRRCCYARQRRFHRTTLRANYIVSRCRMYLLTYWLTSLGRFCGYCVEIADIPVNTVSPVRDDYELPTRWPSTGKKYTLCLENLRFLTRDTCVTA